LKTSQHSSSTALGEFIKSRRERLQPENAGIQPLAGRRRTPGLRREEVAYLAHISITYYTWLEQGRESNPSPEVLLSIGQALQLSEPEQKHLFDLANVDPAGVYGVWSEPRAERGFLQKLVEQLSYPSFISSEDTGAVVAWNRAAKLVVADFGSLPELERNMVYLIFQHPDYRRRLENWEEFARYSAAFLRANFDRYKDNPLFIERFERLRSESKDFNRFWDLFEIQQKRVTTASYFLPDGQRMTFELHYAAAIDNDPNLHWCIFVPAPDTDTELRLVRLLEQDAGV
jgi:transcriptional regulator with XRE-family HTH domain